MYNIIRKKRAEVGLTQKQLAERCGISRQTVSDIETGQHEPGVYIAIALAQALGCAVEDVFKIEEL